MDTIEQQFKLLTECIANRDTTAAVDRMEQTAKAWQERG